MVNFLAFVQNYSYFACLTRSIDYLCKGLILWSKEEIIYIQKRFIAAVNNNELDQLNDLVAPNVIDNDPVAGQVPGPQGYIRFFRSLRRAFPDMNIDVEQIVADEEDSVGFVYTFSGTHYGDYSGVSGTGNHVQIKGHANKPFCTGQNDRTLGQLG